MKKQIFTLALLLSVLFGFAQYHDLKYDKKYYEGYILTNNHPFTKKVVPNQKIECKIKNKDYCFIGSKEAGDTYYVEYITPDGKNCKMWWADIAEIKTDSFYYKLLFDDKDNISRLFIEGKINYWITVYDNFNIEKDGKIINVPFWDGLFQKSKDKVAVSKKEFKKFLINLVSDDTELVAKINDDSYIDYSDNDSLVRRTILKTVKEYDDWYKKNHK